MKMTTITGPDGSVTRIRERRSCGCVTLFLVLLVLALPAQFPAPWNVLAYIATALVLLAGVAVAIGKRTAR